ncbi:MULTISPECIES: acyl carrier protein [Nostoc]|uniref:Acyl carrier protein n=1 Tax=Nostoc paludosum FACHB-159 TaxID=2692908 RepID=A0ABR8K2Z5_9NOSO|nr:MULTISPECIES: acyl carrier protein [Nostoc]MBD2676940.1 acyl carrier protein [Nostoc sp. FACHB-857]MBD2733139.1 acyl carrier protein [Nostoc paludosum FACHB-159]
MTQVFQDQTKNEQLGQLTAAKVQEWLVNYLSNLLEVAPDQIDVKKPFERYGLDSSAAVFLSGDLGDWLGQELDPTLIYNYSTIATLANHIAKGS